MTEICAHLGVNRDTVVEWVTKLGMPGVKVGRLWKFKPGEADDWMRRINLQEN
jgi:excisionase family DNA binding protein